MKDLVPHQDQTQAPCFGNVGVLTAQPPGSPLKTAHNSYVKYNPFQSIVSRIYSAGFPRITLPPALSYIVWTKN